MMRQSCRIRRACRRECYPRVSEALRPSNGAGWSALSRSARSGSALERISSIGLCGDVHRTRDLGPRRGEARAALSRCESHRDEQQRRGWGPGAVRMQNGASGLRRRCPRGFGFGQRRRHQHDGFGQFVTFGSWTQTAVWRTAAVVPDASRRVSTPTSAMPEGARRDGSASTSPRVIRGVRVSLAGVCRDRPSLKPASSRRGCEGARERSAASRRASAGGRRPVPWLRFCRGCNRSTPACMRRLLKAPVALNGVRDGTSPEDLPVGPRAQS